MSEQIKPVAYMLADAVGGSALEFQTHELEQLQLRYGGEIVPLYDMTAIAAKDARIAELEGLLQRILKISDWEINYREDAEECDQEHAAVHADIRVMLSKES